MFSMQRAAFLVAIVIALLITLFYATHGSSLEAHTQRAKSYFSSNTRTERLHLLAPATGPNLDFCKYLLSNTILGYPDPICIGWDGRGHWDGRDSHLFKMSEGLAYLNSIPKEQDHELLLLFDAYDIWMLLRPDVIISRYNKIMKEQAEALEKEGLLGLDNRGEPISNTLLFAADKICWPRAYFDAGCWAVPDTPMPKNQYGPDTDHSMTMNRPKWLNSGTLIGPIGHMRDLFNATMENIERNWFDGFDHLVKNSDQYYLSDLWAEQQITRRKARGDDVKAPLLGHNDDGSDRYGTLPDIPDDRRTEYHLSLDYNVEIWQTAAGFMEVLGWMSFNNTTPQDPQHEGLRKRLDQLELPDDIKRTRGPYDTPTPRDDLPTEKGWEDVILGVDKVLHNVWPLYHLTGDKNYRDRWWHYVWFLPHAKALLEANTQPRESSEPETIAVVDGVRYIAADTSWMANASAPGRKGGIWTDLGQYKDWATLCGEFDDDPRLFPK